MLEAITDDAQRGYGHLRHEVPALSGRQSALDALINNSIYITRNDGVKVDKKFLSAPVIPPLVEEFDTGWISPDDNVKIDQKYLSGTVIPPPVADLHTAYVSTAQQTSACERNEDDFYATVIVERDRCCYQVTGVLIDTGAQKNFVSSALVETARLYTFDVKPQKFQAFGGHIVVADQMVELKVHIAGVCQYIEAFVHASPGGRHLIIGKNGIRAFRINYSGANGPKDEVKVTVAENVVGRRGVRHVVEDD